MTRFYFHVRDDMDVPDDEGADLPDLEAAQAYARDSACSLMCDTLSEQRRIALHHRIDIEDEGGAVLATVRFADAVTIEPAEPAAESGGSRPNAPDV